jgi:hypothetical protein
MSTQAAERYSQLMLDLLAARKLAGGSLTEEEESRRIEELDEQWYQMTDAERVQIEAVLFPTTGPA